MRLDRLWLTDFRSWASAELAPAPEGLTVVVGPNGHGKTNLLEAIGYLATLSSFRGAPNDALVRYGAPSAAVRAEGEREGRRLLLEAEINVGGRDRVLVNRQSLNRARDLLGMIRVSAFSPDDLALVKEGPAGRRQYLDDALVAIHPRNDALRSDLDRILRQRTTLLKQAGGRLSPEIASTLDVWDAKLAEVGAALAEAREQLVDQLAPAVTESYDAVAGGPADIAVTYRRSWDGSLLDALASARTDDIRRGVSTVGPHRDELELGVGGMPARTHASQGEQRSLALSLRLAAHRVITGAIGAAPVLLLDDVFSELDAERSAALLAHLPVGQALLTTASAPPPEARPALTLQVRDGKIIG